MAMATASDFGLEGTGEVNHGWSLIHGHGEVVWIENGRVIKVEPLKHSATPETFY